MISSYTISSDLNVISVIFVDLSIEGLGMLLMIVPFSSVCVFSCNSANKPATLEKKNCGFIDGAYKYVVFVGYSI